MGGLGQREGIVIGTEVLKSSYIHRYGVVRQMLFRRLSQQLQGAQQWALAVGERDWAHSDYKEKRES